ncbi:RCC1 domain-containing protein [Geomesophilobacter sediminis]|uniref:RCC1-like domain-containing protein n=1 Tax=Geomesophilobacter sediminis TaxID=2798584 RepID=A0A8J7J0C5_9BACT|nr:hypothetical protein [Geomesophilobacter sediminis]MBJ6723793.1 hypothetical protein [Geomesophilobacter sediminis]
MSNFNGMVKNVVAQVVVGLAMLVGTLVTGMQSAEAATPWYAYGSEHTLVLKADGTVWAVGANGYGQLGNGKSSWFNTSEPRPVPGMSNVVAIAAAGAHSVALKGDGTVWAWGNNAAGQLGNGTTSDSAYPVQVTGLVHVKAIAAGKSHVVALKENGTIWAWGNNRIGQLGNETRVNSSVPVQVTGISGIVSIAAGSFHTLALKEDGTVWCWGYDANGALGMTASTVHGTTAPTRVAGLSDIKAIAAGMHHSVALRKDGTAWIWGSNASSQLGNGERSEGSAVPMRVAGLGDLMDVTAKANSTIALRGDGTVWAWGDAGSGEWGNGVSMAGSERPVQMRGLTGATMVAALVKPETVVSPTATFLAQLQRDAHPREAIALSTAPAGPKQKFVAEALFTVALH